jgi:uncharacterized protein YxeA
MYLTLYLSFPSYIRISEKKNKYLTIHLIKKKMGLHYASLDTDIRTYMVSEFNSDVDNETCYVSKRFHDKGKNSYIEAMPSHLTTGNDDSLMNHLSTNKCFNATEFNKNGKENKVPITASQTFSEGEFNRFYMRGVCLKAIEDKGTVIVYRARHSENPSPESEALIGTFVNAEQLLNDLRMNIGLETRIGLARPNSGLSVRL